MAISTHPIGDSQEFQELIVLNDREVPSVKVLEEREKNGAPHIHDLNFLSVALDHLEVVEKPGDYVRPMDDG